MAQSKSEGEKNNQMELENEKKEPVEAKPEVYILDEDDDDFEEFEIEDYEEDLNQEENVDLKQWQEDWGDEDIDDQFVQQLRKELNIKE